MDRVDPELVTWVAAGLALLALLLAAVAWRRLRVVDRRLARLLDEGVAGASDGGRLVALEAEVDRVRSDLRPPMIMAPSRTDPFPGTR